jgi:hypothetical protein
VIASHSDQQDGQNALDGVQPICGRGGDDLSAGPAKGPSGTIKSAVRRDGLR